MYQNSQTVLGKVANAGLAYLTGARSTRYFRNDDPVNNPIPNDSNIFGYTITASRTTYGIISVSISVAPYTKVYRYSCVVIGWT